MSLIPFLKLIFILIFIVFNFTSHLCSLNLYPYCHQLSHDNQQFDIVGYYAKNQFKYRKLLNILSGKFFYLHLNPYKEIRNHKLSETKREIRGLVQRGQVVRTVRALQSISM